ncbi:MAG: superoxide dismutase [Patescibacteria group bacterium]
MTSHTLPKLPYAYDALEPYIDAQTMEIHHTKHHQTYINNLNLALEKHPEFSDMTAENLIKNIGSIPEDIRPSVKNNAGGHLNHTFFWTIMRPPTEKGPEDGLIKTVNSTFGSLDGFKDLFTKTALTRFGSGWAWLSVTNLGGLEIHSTTNQDNPIIEGLVPILGLDVWEHAYYLKYQNRRQEYIENWWKVVNWDQVTENYQKAVENIKPNI